MFAFTQEMECSKCLYLTVVITINTPVLLNPFGKADLEGQSFVDQNCHQSHQCQIL